MEHSHRLPAAACEHRQQRRLRRRPRRPAAGWHGLPESAAVRQSEGQAAAGAALVPSGAWSGAGWKAAMHSPAFHAVPSREAVHHGAAQHSATQCSGIVHGDSFSGLPLPVPADGAGVGRGPCHLHGVGTTKCAPHAAVASPPFSCLPLASIRFPHARPERCAPLAFPALQATASGWATAWARSRCWMWSAGASRGRSRAWRAA